MKPRLGVLRQAYREKWASLFTSAPWTSPFTFPLPLFHTLLSSPLYRSLSFPPSVSFPLSFTSSRLPASFCYRLSLFSSFIKGLIQSRSIFSFLHPLSLVLTFPSFSNLPNFFQTNPIFPIVRIFLERRQFLFDKQDFFTYAIQTTIFFWNTILGAIFGNKIAMCQIGYCFFECCHTLNTVLYFPIIVKKKSVKICNLYYYRNVICLL